MPFFKKWKNNSKHRKLQSEEMALEKAKETEAEIPDTPESDIDVATFKIKYLGSTVVEKISPENATTESVKNIMKVAKAAKKKLQRVNLAVSAKGIAVTDNQGNSMFEISIYRISNCATDSNYKQVFSFISTDHTETMECHAFWCSKRKIAESVALSVARAFSNAYENWRMLPLTQQIEKAAIENAENLKNKANAIKIEDVKEPSEDGSCKNESTSSVEEKLIDFDDDEDDTDFQNITFPPHRFVTEVPESNLISLQNGLIPMKTAVGCTVKNEWVCFEDDFEPKTTQFPSQRWNSNSNQIDLVFA